jgi:hypothetical protein
MIQIRKATIEDAQLIFDFIMELAIYEKAAHEVVASVPQIRETLFGADPRAFALICGIDDKPAGYAIYFYNYSTWIGRNGIYLEDIYVSPAHR